MNTCICVNTICVLVYLVMTGNIHYQLLKFTGCCTCTTVFHEPAVVYLDTKQETVLFLLGAHHWQSRHTR